MDTEEQRDKIIDQLELLNIKIAMQNSVSYNFMKDSSLDLQSLPQ